MHIQVDTAYNSPHWQNTNWHAQGKDFDIQAMIHNAIYTCVSTFERGGCEISVVLANNDFIQQLNHTYRQKNTPTNVLSFPAHDEYMVGDMVENLGDVVIAFETMIRESEQQQKSTLNHFIHLLVHGVLHLLGLNHETPTQAQQMERLERHILKKLGIADPYAGTEIIE